jgi:cell division protein FtsW
MGAGTVINKNRGQDAAQPAAAASQARTHRPAWLGFDIPLLLVVISLLVFGILMVYSASADFSYQVYGSATYILSRQVGWLALGSVAMLVLTFINYHRWSYFSIPLMAVTLILLIWVLLVQEERYGAVRSIFSGSAQPSELAKLAIVIYLSIWLYNRRDQVREIRLWIVPLAVILGTVGGLILMQPDLSAVIMIVLLGTMMIFLAGGGVKQLGIVLALGVIVGLILLRSNLFPTGPDRVASYLAGLKDPLEYSDHVRQALEAFIRGGWFGVGIGMSQTKLLGLPFPHTDSIFAVVGEEMGVFGSAILVLLYLLLLWRGLVIARKAPDGLGALLASGLSVWLVSEACINMAVMVGLLPFAGNTLPFISSGGSSLIVAMSAVGIMLNVSRLAEKQKLGEERTSNAVVDLRRGDRRQRISRPGRPAKSAVQD